MYILVNILFLIIFLFIMFYFNLPDMNNNNYIMHKIALTIGLFIFQFILLLISKIKNKCKIDICEITLDSLQVALSGFVAYTFYTDYIYKNKLVPYAHMNKNYHNLIVAIIITLSVMFIKIIRMLISTDYLKCERYD